MNTLGIFIGLVLGKPLGIVAFSLLGIKTKLANLPATISLRQLIGVGFLGGIGFTMSIFITLLAFDESLFAQSSKIAILAGSLLAGLIGYILLNYSAHQET